MSTANERTGPSPGIPTAPRLSIPSADNCPKASKNDAGKEIGGCPKDSINRGTNE